MSIIRKPHRSRHDVNGLIPTVMILLIIVLQTATAHSDVSLAADSTAAVPAMVQSLSAFWVPADLISCDQAV